MTRFVNPVPKYTDENGAFMPYGLLYFYESGTNDDKTTFADVNESIANPQPLVLNGDGSTPNCFYSGAAKVVLITNAGTQSAPIDGDQQWERDPVTSDAIGSLGSAWDSITIYDMGAIVTLNSIFYVSIINDNQNKNPSSTLTAWTQFDLLKRWNTNETYGVRDPVIATDFTLYISQVASNTGNDPISSPTEWLPSGAGSGGSFAFADWDISIDYPVGGTALVTGSDGEYYESIQTPNLNHDPNAGGSPTFWKLFDLHESTAASVSFDDTLLPFTATTVQAAVTLASPIAWGVFNFDTDTLTSGGGCTVVRNSVGNATITLTNAVSAAINTMVLTNEINNSGVFFSTTQGFLVSKFQGNTTGTAVITNGTTSKAVLNPANSQPLNISAIQLTPNETLGSASYTYISGVTSTHFTVALDVDPGKDVDIAYYVSLESQGKDITNFAFAVYDTGA